MDALARKIIDAHGGLDRWKNFTTLTAHLRQGGVLWPLKGHGGKLDETNVTVGLGREWASHSPFGPEGKVTRFEPGRVEIRDAAGKIVEELDEPRASFAGHTLETPWTEPQLAYFAGIAMWTYLNMPFLLAAPGVVSRSVGEWREKGETWQKQRHKEQELPYEAISRMVAQQHPRHHCSDDRQHPGRDYRVAEKFGDFAIALQGDQRPHRLSSRCRRCELCSAALR